MTRVRARGEGIRRFILENVERHPTDISKQTAEKFDITRQAVNKHLQKLMSEHSLSETGHTRNRSYRLAPKLEWRGHYQIVPGLAEDVVWKDDILPVLGEQPENVLDMWRFCFTEMFNNAMDHSGGKEILVHILRTAIDTEMSISDDGIGIFKKIQDALGLLDERHAILELSKGKLTTDPQKHTGEGIFFTSRMMDSFDILSGGVFFSHVFGKEEDWIMERDQFKSGTTVFLKLSNHTSRTLTKIYDQFSPGSDDYGFNKTVVPVRLAQYGNDKLISRSQAKRLLARVELFKIVMFDFADVPTIGQAFADEIFRVFANEHPNIQLLPIHTSSAVTRMIERAKAGGAAEAEAAATAATEAATPDTKPLTS
jgi:anti-sigma regulatory factor (Ser/Thr protein kinase)